MPALNLGARLVRALISRGKPGGVGGLDRMESAADSIVYGLARILTTEPEGSAAECVRLNCARSAIFLKPDKEMKAYGHSESVST